jgi:hypothetical protein
LKHFRVRTQSDQLHKLYRKASILPPCPPAFHHNHPTVGGLKEGSRDTRIQGGRAFLKLNCSMELTFMLPPA